MMCVKFSVLSLKSSTFNKAECLLAFDVAPHTGMRQLENVTPLPNENVEILASYYGYDDRCDMPWWGIKSYSPLRDLLQTTSYRQAHRLKASKTPQLVHFYHVSRMEVRAHFSPISAPPFCPLCCKSFLLAARPESRRRSQRLPPPKLQSLFLQAGQCE